MKYKCPKCGWENSIFTYYYKCPICGGPIDIEYRMQTLSKDILEKRGFGITKYKEILPGIKKYITLGEGNNPVIYDKEDETYYILEYLNPSGSFKDRGAAYTISYLYSYYQDIRDIVEDSSGNAGISFTLYGKVSGFNVHIFIPRNAPEGKVKYIKMLGGIIHKASSRDEANKEALEYAKNKLYVGHLYNPFFLIGIETLPYDIYKVLDEIDHVYIPFGSGTLYIGFYRGLSNLWLNDLVSNKPKIHIVEAAGYEKISESKSNEKSTYLDGIKVTVVPRIDEVKRSLENLEWDTHVITDEEAAYALKRLIKKGFIVEPTSAASYAGLIKDKASGDIKRGEKSLIILTGSGLKMINEILNMFRETKL